MKFYAIERQTMLVGLAPILLMAALLESYIVHTRYADLENALLERSQLMVRQVATSSEFAVFSGNTSMLQQNIDSALLQQDVKSLLVLDAGDRPLVGGNGAGREQAEYLLARANKSNPVYQDADILVLYEPIAPTLTMLHESDFVTPIRSVENKPLGATIIEVSKHRLSAQKSEILRFSLAITLSVMVATLMLALWVARRVTRPIVRMSQALRIFGEGELETRISPLPNVAELNDMSMGFNRMAQQLQHHHELLEDLIVERTSALASREQESRTLTDNSPDTMARYDRGCRRIYVNPALGALGGGVAALLGKKASEIPGGSQFELYEEAIKEVFATGKESQFELEWPSHESKGRFVHVRLVPEHDQTGGVVTVLGIGRDITDRKAADIALKESMHQLEEKEQAKSRFLAAAGHDLRQPLAAANLFIDALMYSAPTPDQEKIIKRLNQTMSNFNGLLDSLLNVSKLDAGVIKPDFAPIEVADIFNWIEGSFASLAEQKHIRLKLHFSKREALVVRTDRGLLCSVLSNLVSNAIKYTLKGTVLVSARRRGSNMLFQIWDTGIGIADEQVKKIFDEFYQVDNPHRDRTSGLGLGLAIAKRALALIDGEIVCRSQLGRGSVFEFVMPLDGSSNRLIRETGTMETIDVAANRSFVQGKRFIVLEDDGMVSEALSKSLEMLGGKVECFNNAEYALQHPDIGNADCYIVDYMLPGGIDGINFLLLLHQQLRRRVCAVMMSGNTSTYFIRKVEFFAWPVLHKPVHLSKLIATLEEQFSKIG